MDPSDESQHPTEAKHCGFIAFIGAPNAGKSTLINRLVGQKVSIVTHKPQTTRRRVLGLAIVGSSQLVFIDTPGIFKPKRALDKAMIAQAWGALEQGELLGVVVDVGRRDLSQIYDLLDTLKETKFKPFLVLNKIDSVPSAKLLQLSADLNARCPFETTFMISALKGSGVNDLMSYLVSQLPEGPWLYPEDQVSDVSDRDLAAEIVREKLFLRLHQELPYHLTVVPESWREQADGSVRFEAIIYVERDSHRMIVLGEKGAQIKAVGQAARLELAAALGRTVHLFLHVKVQPKWTQNAQMFKKMGLDFSDT